MCIYRSVLAFVASGIFYGWAGLYTLFLEAGVYDELCPTPGVVCGAQKSRLQLIYTGKQKNRKINIFNVLYFILFFMFFFYFYFFISKLLINIISYYCFVCCCLVASSVNLCSQLPWGYILDRVGPRKCCALSTSLVIAGFILLSSSARGWGDFYMSAIVLIAGVNTKNI
jgi:hypothetical protein